MTVNELRMKLDELIGAGKGGLDVYVMRYDDPGFQDVASEVRLEGDMDHDGNEIEWVEVRA